MTDRSPADAAQDAAGALARARAAIARETRRARVALALERAARLLWPLWAVVAAFLGLALLGVPQALPYAAHLAVLAGFAAAALLAAMHAVRGWRAPGRAEAEARLDADAPGRPVAALGDALAAGASDPASRSLWAAHQARMAVRAAKVKAAPADLRVSAQDRFALRHAALLALAAGALGQLGDGGARLAEALSPAAASAAMVERRDPSLEAWASPPSYTGVAPLYLTERVSSPGDGPTALPAGTEIVLRVFDAPNPPVLSGPAGAVAAEDLGGGVWSATVVLDADGAVRAEAEGVPLGDWDFAAIPDAPPSIGWTAPPETTDAGALTFGFELSDDYGVVTAAALVALDGAAEAPGPGFPADSPIEPFAIDLPLPLTRAAEAARETVEQDLTAHPWAGLPVTLTLRAEDGAGQAAEAGETFVLPARRFFDPVARALIEQRRDLAWSMAGAPRAHRVLEAITAHPDDLFEDVTVFLTVRTAMRRLGYALAEDRLREEVPGVIDLLWEAALRLEEGGLSVAERRLRNAQEALAEAMRDGAEQDEIARLMDELREAMRQYLEQLAQEAMRNPETAENQQPVDPDQMLSQNDLDRMLEEIERAMREGRMEDAQRMLQALQEMMQNLRMAQQQGQQGEGQGDQAMRELQDMIGEQQGLADRSFDALRRGQQQGQQGEGQQGEGQQGQGQQGQGQGEGEGQGDGRRPGSGRGDLGSIARDQESLRQMLDQLRQGLSPGGQDGQEGAGSEALDQAERSMGEARDALERGDADGALQRQVEALDRLREGARDLAQQQGEQGQSQRAGRDGRGGDVREEDPFGRPRATDGPLDGDSVRVPDGSVMKRARELMDEIRRRSGERFRPPAELDYLDRLLDRF